MKKKFFFYNGIFLRNIILKKAVFIFLPHKFLIRKSLDFTKRLYLIDTDSGIFNFKSPKKSKSILLKKSKKYRLINRYGTMRLKFLFKRKKKKKLKQLVIKKKRVKKKKCLKLQAGVSIVLDRVLNTNSFNPSFSFFYFKKKIHFKKFQYLSTLVSHINNSIKYIKLKRSKKRKPIKKDKNFFLKKGVKLKYIHGVFFFFKKKYALAADLQRISLTLFAYSLTDSKIYRKQVSKKQIRLYSFALRIKRLKQFAKDKAKLYKKEERLHHIPKIYMQKKAKWLKKKSSSKKQN